MSEDQPGATTPFQPFQPPEQQQPLESTEPIGTPQPSQSTFPEPFEWPQAPEPRAPLTSADRWRAAVVAVLNLSGLGMGYALMRRWVAAALCWLATGILLLVALPVTASGVSGGLLVVYLIVLVIAAVHGAFRALRSELTWPRTPRVARVFAVALLLVPIGAVALYDQAHANAVQLMLLGQLDQADNLVLSTSGESFTDAQPQYDSAMKTYQDLLDNHGGSRAALQVPAKLAFFYQTVAADYARNDYCNAIAPLSYLRNLTSTVGAADLGAMATWPDDRLATSLYQCGTAALGSGDSNTSGNTTDLSTLLSTFPTSAQAAKVEPAVAASISKAAAGISGSKPCDVTSTLQTLASQAAAVTGGSAAVSAALHKDAATATSDLENGTFACGESQYKSGDYSDAETTMNNFTSTYPNDPNKALAQDYDIAAQVAAQDSAAGKVTPTTASGGDVTVTILNDSPDPIQILYTGPVTGSATIGACGKCTTYSSNATAQADACTDSSISYPQTTISLQAGTTYFLQQSTGGTGETPFTSSQQYDAGNAYGYCAYETDLFNVF
jgi:hypothetical protein